MSGRGRRAIGLGSGRGSSGGQHHIQRPAGWFWPTVPVSGCLCEFPQRFHLAVWDLLDLEPRVGIVRILLGAGV